MHIPCPPKAEVMSSNLVGCTNKINNLGGVQIFAIDCPEALRKQLMYNHLFDLNYN